MKTNTFFDKASSMTPAAVRRPVRLLHVLGSSKFGGGSVVVYRLVQMARQMGFQVDVLTTDPVFQKLLRENDIPVVDLDVIWREIRPLRDLFGLVRLWRFLSKSDYDIVHTHTSKGGFVGRLAAKAAGIGSIIHTVHGFAFHEESPAWALHVYAFLERLAAFACDRIVTVSEYHRRWALDLAISSPEKLVAIPNGIPAERAQADTAREDIRRELGIAPDARMLLSTGRLANQKGLEYLIEAAQLVKSQLETPFKVVFAGSGPIQPLLEKLAAERGLGNEISFVGFRNDIGDLLAASDIVVLPTLHEGLSIALLEAMAAGKPVITTTIGSNLEVTQDGKAAELVPVKDARALADAIIKLVRDPFARVMKAKKAKEVFAQCYTESRMLDHYRSEYFDLLDTARTPVVAASSTKVAALRQVYGRESWS